MDDSIKMAFEFARDTTKQLITLATGIIALEITFAKDFVKTLDPTIRIYALVSWLAFMLSVFFGMWTLMALTGTLEAENESVPVSIRGKNVKLPSILQVLSFLMALALTVIFGIKAI
jgi:hypothetical protein